MLDFHKGQRIELTYPESTLVESIARLQKRSIQVTRVRDLLLDPLTPQEFLRRPMTRRSRWLVTGFDERSKSFRQFYAGSSIEHESPGVLKIALYEPDGKGPVYPISRPFGPTKRERIRMARIVASCARRELKHELTLGIYCDDLRLMASG